MPASCACSPKSQQRTCTCTQLGGKLTKKNEVVIITIETCGKDGKSCKGGKGDKTSGDKKSSKKKKRKEDTSDSSDRSQSRESRRSRSRTRDKDKDKDKRSKRSKSRERSTDRGNKLPLVSPRIHGKGCAMEFNILEKHDRNCAYRKQKNSGRKREDRTGSYECIGRITFGTCNQSSPPDDAADAGGEARVRRRRHPRDEATPGMRVYGPDSSEISNWNADIEEKMTAKKARNVEAPIQKTQLTDSEIGHPRPTENMEWSYKDMRARREDEEMRNRILSSEQLLRTAQLGRDRNMLRPDSAKQKTPSTPQPQPKKTLHNEGCQTEEQLTAIDAKAKKKLEKERRRIEKLNKKKK